MHNPLHGEGLGEGCRDTIPDAHLPTVHTPCASPDVPSSSLPPFSSREYFRAIARLGIQAAEALDHAHQNGILHRDIKPANLLVDGTGKLWVTDFGLARVEADAGMTMTGDLLGTLRYMSPEQASGQPGLVDARTDIHALGATLYELLTLQPAFAGGDRQELVKRIAFEDPKKLRQHNSRIPVDLETVIAKAMEKNPADRYATAQDLAEDLHCFTTDQPIKARQPTTIQQISKWARRNKTLVTTAAISVAMLIMFSLVMLAASNAAITEERNEKTAALERAGRNFQMVLAVIDRSPESVADKTLADVPQLETLRKKLMGDALEFYEKLLEENPNDPTVQFAAARAQVRLAMLNQEYTKWTEAIRLNESAIAVLEELLRLQPSNADYRYQLATALKQRSWNAMAIPTSHEEDADRARRAVAIFQGLYDEFPGEATYSAAVLEALLTLDVWSSTTAETEELLTKMIPLADHSEMTPRLRAEVQNRRASVAQGHGRLDEAEELYREAIRAHREGVEENPTEALTRAHLVRDYNRLGNLLLAREKLEEAVEVFDQSFDVALGLKRDYPTMPHYQEFALEALLPLLDCLMRLGRSSDAEALLSRWELSTPGDFIMLGQIYGSMQHLDPAIDEFVVSKQLRPAVSHMFSGVAYYLAGDDAKALAAYQASLDTDADFWMPYNGIAWLLAASHDEGLRDGERAIELATKACELTNHKNADNIATLAAAHAEAGDYEQAIHWSKQAIELVGENSVPGQAIARRLANYKAGRPWRIAEDER